MITSYQVTAGALTQVSSVTGGNTVVALDPVHRYLYGLSQNGANTFVTLYGYAYAAGGALTASGSSSLAGASCAAAAIDPAGTTLLVDCRNTFTLLQLGIDATTGALTPTTGSPFAASGGVGNRGLLVDPSGRFAFMADDAHDAVVTFTLPASGPVTSAVSSSLPVSVAGSAEQLAMPHSGGFLYALAVGAPSSVSAFSVAANGSLTSIAGSPYVVPSATGQAQTIVEDAAGAWVATGNVNGTSAISIFPVRADGTLGARVDAAVTADTAIDGLGFDPAMGMFFAVTYDKLYAFTFDQASGQLTPSGSPIALP
jgi:6-phosphogluconolactonase (cycloisomerase 2 family)